MAGWHKIDSDHLESCSSIVQSISARLLLAIAHKRKLKETCGGRGQHLPKRSNQREGARDSWRRIWERIGCLVETIKSLRGGPVAPRSLVLCVGDFVQTLGHAPPRADLDSWTKKDPNHDGCSLAPAHADGFLTIETDPEPIMEAFKENFGIRHDELSPAPCLGLEWETSELGKIKNHDQKRAKE